MNRNGWTLYAYPLFDEQYDRLASKVEAAKKADPAHYESQPAYKLLATIERYIEQVIPGNPSSPQFRQGSTLGNDNRHWFRAKFHERYRLFFRFSTKDKIIIYAWVNDESTLRKSGSKTDPYALFQGMLKSGNPPANLEELIAASRRMP
jgi:toxin YhaV